MVPGGSGGSFGADLRQSMLQEGVPSVRYQLSEPCGVLAAVYRVSRRCGRSRQIAVGARVRAALFVLRECCGWVASRQQGCYGRFEVLTWTGCDWGVPRKQGCCGLVMC